MGLSALSNDLFNYLDTFVKQEIPRSYRVISKKVESFVDENYEKIFFSLGACTCLTLKPVTTITVATLDIVLKEYLNEDGRVVHIHDWKTIISRMDALATTISAFACLYFLGKDMRHYSIMAKAIPLFGGWAIGTVAGRILDKVSY
jgi:hypothetical protein